MKWLLRVVLAMVIVSEMNSLWVARSNQLIVAAACAISTALAWVVQQPALR